MAAISLESIHLCECSICCKNDLLEEELKANEMFAKEVDIVEDRTIVNCVARLSASSSGLTGVKVLVGCQHIDAAVAQPFEMVKTCWDGDVMRVVIIEQDRTDQFGLGAGCKEGPVAW